MISKPVSVIGAELAHHMFRDPPPTSPETLYHPTITVTERQLAIMLANAVLAGYAACTEDVLHLTRPEAAKRYVPPSEQS